MLFVSTINVLSKILLLIGHIFCFEKIIIVGRNSTNQIIPIEETRIKE